MECTACPQDRMSAFDTNHRQTAAAFRLHTCWSVCSCWSPAMQLYPGRMARRHLSLMRQRHPVWK